MLKKIRVNRLFFGATGVSIEHGLTVLNSFHVEWKSQIVACADCVTLLAESSKFGKVGLIQFATIDNLDEIITDYHLERDIEQELMKRGLSLTICQKSG